MVSTHGLTHIALSVRDLRRAFDFYRQVFGVVAVYEDATSIQAQTPGTRDVLVFEQDKGRAGRAGGVAHFGFRLVEPQDIAGALAALKGAGAKILSTGEFSPGHPFVFFRDPDGYEVEIWHEPPTPVDPPAG